MWGKASERGGDNLLKSLECFATLYSLDSPAIPDLGDLKL